MMQSWLHHCESTDRKSTRDRNLRLSNEMHKLCVDTLKMKRNPLFQPQKLYQVSLLHLGKRRIKHPPRGSLMRRNNCSTKSAMMQVIARVVCLFFIHSSSPSCESLTAAAAAAEAKRNGIFFLLGLSFCCCSNSQQCTIRASSLSLSHSPASRWLISCCSSGTRPTGTTAAAAASQSIFQFVSPVVTSHLQ